MLKQQLTITGLFLIAVNIVTIIRQQPLNFKLIEKLK